MLDSATLNRVSCSYARGYRDGYAKRPNHDALASAHPFDRPFASHDYAEGYKAGANDRRCSDYHADRFMRAEGLHQ